MKYVLAMDQGTTSSRAILFDAGGRVVSSAKREFPQIYPHQGWVEQDPAEILNSQFSSVLDAMEMAGAAAIDIAAIGITNQRETTIVWEKATGKPVGNAIVWQCRRTADICETLTREGLSNYITDTTGLLIDPYFSGTKIKWILDNTPGAKERAERGELLFGTVDTWLVWNLTGGEVHATDYSNASRTMLFDIEKLRWDETLLNALSIPEAMLPDVRSSNASFGTVAKGAGDVGALLAGVPIAGVAGDQHAALFGQACFETGQAKNTYGTGCFLMMNTGSERKRSKHRLLSTIAWGLDGKVSYALEGSIFNAGSVINWLRDELGIISEPHECDILAESVETNGGVYFVPAFTGLGAPHWDPYARGTIVGLTRGSNKRHIARAVLEAIAYQTADFMGAFESDAGLAVRDLRVDGGASVSDVMMRFQADITGKRVIRPACVETTALGAAALAAIHVGFWNDTEEFSKIWRVEKTFDPTMDSGTRDDLYGAWKRAVERAKQWAQ